MILMTFQISKYGRDDKSYGATKNLVSENSFIFYFFILTQRCFDILFLFLNESHHDIIIHLKVKPRFLILIKPLH